MRFCVCAVAKLIDLKTFLLLPHAAEQPRGVQQLPLRPRPAVPRDPPGGDRVPQQLDVLHPVRRVRHGVRRDRVRRGLRVAELQDVRQGAGGEIQRQHIGNETDIVLESRIDFAVLQCLSYNKVC